MPDDRLWGVAKGLSSLLSASQRSRILLGLRYFGRLGSAAALEREAERLGVRWVRGQSFARRLYREGASACESVAA